MAQVSWSADLRVATYNPLIDAHGTPRHLEGATVLEAMQRAGLRPNPVAYSNARLIEACRGSLQVARSLEKVKQMMQQEGLRPTAIAFESLVHACGLTRDIEMAFRVMTYMAQVSAPPTPHSGVYIVP